MLRWVAVIIVLTACASPARPREPRQVGGLRPGELVQPALVVRVAFPSVQFTPRERTELPAEYESALLEALNARAVLTRDTQLAADGKLDPRAALARAREVGADHAVLVDVFVERGEVIVCQETRRPRRATVTRWSQGVRVLRASDGAERLVIERGRALAVSDAPDCADPGASRSRAEALAEAIAKLVAALVGRER